MTLGSRTESPGVMDGRPQMLDLIVDRIVVFPTPVVFYGRQHFLAEVFPVLANDKMLDQSKSDSDSFCAIMSCNTMEEQVL